MSGGGGERGGGVKWAHMVSEVPAVTKNNVSGTLMRR